MRALGLALLLAAIALPASAQKDPPPAENGIEPLTRKGYELAKVWLAPVASALVGFGTGHMFQERYRGYPIYFTLTDGVGYALILSILGSCARDMAKCEASQKTRARMGLGLLLVSRLLQLGDVALWGADYHRRFHVDADAVAGGGLISISWRY